MDNGKEIGCMGSVRILGRADINLGGVFMIINLMGKDNVFTQMEISIKEILSSAKDTEKVNLCGPRMVQVTMEISLITRCMDRVFISGKMEVRMMELMKMI